MTVPGTSIDQLSRIRKLLDTAESFSAKGTEEAEETAKSYREKAFELAARYEIEHALLRGTETKPEKVINRIFSVGKPYSYQIVLAHLVYSRSGCDTIRLSSRTTTRSGRTRALAPRLHVFGFKSDMDRADMLWTSLVVQATREAARGYRRYVEEFEPWSCDECEGTGFRAIPMDSEWYRCTDCGNEFYAPSGPAINPDRRPTWYRSFWNGWVAALDPRIEALRKAAKQEAIATEAGKGTEIALRNRDVAVREVRDIHYPKTRRTRATQGTSGSGYNAGREAGRRADLGGGKLGATRREVER